MNEVTDFRTALQTEKRIAGAWRTCLSAVGPYTHFLSFEVTDGFTASLYKIIQQNHFTVNT